MAGDPIRTSVPEGLSLRRSADADRAFLAEVYASTRREELAAVPWSEADKEAFLRSQFDLQDRHYQEHYPAAEFLVIERRGPAGVEAIGRVYVDRWPGEIRLVDVSLLPAHRGRGHGTALLQGLLREGDASGLPVTIHVESNNPAMSLYHRLGFRPVDTHGIYHLLRREPGGQAVTGVRP